MSYDDDDDALSSPRPDVQPIPVAEAEAAGTLHLQGALFDIAEGVLRVLNHDTGKFEAVSVEWTDTAAD